MWVVIISDEIDDSIISVFGPFNSEEDANAYAIQHFGTYYTVFKVLSPQ